MIEIKDWNDLAKFPPSKTHYIDVEVDEDKDYNSYWISPFDKSKHEHYLSTHTFYGGETTKEYNKLLKKCGFNAKIVVEEE